MDTGGDIKIIAWIQGEIKNNNMDI